MEFETTRWLRNWMDNIGYWDTEFSLEFRTYPFMTKISTLFELRASVERTIDILSQCIVPFLVACLQDLRRSRCNKCSCPTWLLSVLLAASIAFPGYGYQFDFNVVSTMRFGTFGNQACVVVPYFTKMRRVDCISISQFIYNSAENRSAGPLRPLYKRKSRNRDNWTPQT